MHLSRSRNILDIAEFHAAGNSWCFRALEERCVLILTGQRSPDLHPTPIPNDSPAWEACQAPEPVDLYLVDLEQLFLGAGT
jgi:hypothetical protein